MKILMFTTPDLLIIRLDEISEREQQLLAQRGAPALMQLWNELQDQGPRKRLRFTERNILHLSRLHHLGFISEAEYQARRTEVLLEG